MSTPSLKQPGGCSCSPLHNLKMPARSPCTPKSSRAAFGRCFNGFTSSPPTPSYTFSWANSRYLCFIFVIPQISIRRIRLCLSVYVRHPSIGEFPTVPSAKTQLWPPKQKKSARGYFGADDFTPSSFHVGNDDIFLKSLESSSRVWLM